MTNRWVFSTAVLAVLLVASLGLEAAGVNPFTLLAGRSAPAQPTASAPGLIPVTVGIGGAGTPGTNVPELGSRSARVRLPHRGSTSSGSPCSQRPIC